MIVVKYLIINHRGNVIVREREPKMAGNEIALRFELNVPDALFGRPTLKAVMKIPEDAVPKTSITPEITDNIGKIIKEVTGLEMHISVIPHEEEEK